jgi:hypothetical protein
VDIARLPEAKKMIQEFRKKMNQFLRGTKPTQVYRMSIGMFKITKGTKHE